MLSIAGGGGMSSSSTNTRGAMTAIWSGTWGAVASSFAKVAFSPRSSSVLQFIFRHMAWFMGTKISTWSLSSFLTTNEREDGDFMRSNEVEGTFPEATHGHQTKLLSFLVPLVDALYEMTLLELMVRGVCLLMMVLCNLLAISTFVQGLEESGSISGTALTTAANCLVSTVLGIFLWKEPIPSFAGLLCVLVGILLLLLRSDGGVEQRQSPSLSSIPETTATRTTTKVDDNTAPMKSTKAE